MKKRDRSYERSLPRDLVERINAAYEDPNFERAFQALAEPEYVKKVRLEGSFRHSKGKAEICMRKVKDMTIRVGIYAKNGTGYVARVGLDNFNKVRKFAAYLIGLRSKLHPDPQLG